MFVAVIVLGFVGAFSWANFGGWVATAMSGTVASETIQSLQSHEDRAAQLIDGLEARTIAPLTFLAEVSACIPTDLSPPLSLPRDRFDLIVIPVVLDAAYEKDGNRNNSVYGFSTETANNDKEGWTVLFEVRLQDGGSGGIVRDCTVPSVGRVTSQAKVYALAR